ncbi:voltage-dependent calcium channel beta subunit-associated regulatory protein-like [Salvelinus namaycush]|uniref:Voltage-dependent calcium channel beta subunit-associated regulatory protein-like n=1 Tax=Salvelinus namaycush TaxID=8040 RepID=A0A8U1BXM2_SALNM|nr:voltage-dependent calcium channel beta subunit-associated regulatory protein-like [Salvelinus namaycush]XP_038856985.1 voltage-dependent calcium channel beta subunit-associated regulatory protein-like [Salvelinus namaycush]XP_038856986.1 voltage-dependent calcium channel beta subunit-associated regulatory protein-like [Salvelinus namaycush]
MSNESTVWINLTENSTGVPFEPGKQQGGYVLLLVLLSIFLGGTLVLLSVLLIVCRRCCDGDCRHARASDDPEKTNTSYMEESQPVHGQITIRVDESDCLSAASSHVDMETERFLSTGTQGGRRVSFNEVALFDHGKKAQEKGRRSGRFLRQTPTHSPAVDFSEYAHILQYNTTTALATSCLCV